LELTGVVGGECVGGVREKAMYQVLISQGESNSSSRLVSLSYLPSCMYTCSGADWRGLMVRREAQKPVVDWEEGVCTEPRRLQKVLYWGKWVARARRAGLRRE
jgi:hypothetical protein